MGGLLNYGRADDDLDYPEWLRGHQQDLDQAPDWLQLKPMEEEGQLAPEPPPVRQIIARRGDNISKLVGSSDPATIAAFGRANGLKPGDSTIYAGRSYRLPSDLDIDPANRGEGLLMIRRDNSRLAQRQAERDQVQSLREQQAAEMQRWLDETSYLPNYGQRPIATSFDRESRPAPRRHSAESYPPGRVAAPAQPQTGLLGAPFRLPPSRFDQSPAARAIGGYLAGEMGKQIGYATGVGKTIEGAGKGALFLARLINPIDPIISDDGDAAWDHVVGGIGSTIDYGRSRYQDPSLLRQDISKGWSSFRQAHDPSATAPGATLEDELNRRFSIGRNDSELAVGVGSLVAGGPALKALSRAGALSRVSTAAELVAMGWPERYVPRLSEPYDAMGHHNIRRAWTKNSPLLREIADGPMFRVDGQGMTWEKFLPEHYGLDSSYHGGPVTGGGGWSGKALGMTRYNLPKRLWRGTPPLMKASIGTGAAIGVASAEQARKRR